MTMAFTLLVGVWQTLNAWRIEYLNKWGVANDRTDTISAYPNFGCYCDVVFLSRCFVNNKIVLLIRFIKPWQCPQSFYKDRVTGFFLKAFQPSN